MRRVMWSVVAAGVVSAGAMAQETKPEPKKEGGAAVPMTPIKPAAGEQPKPDAKEEVTLKVGDKAPALVFDEFVKGEKVAGFEPGKVYVVEFWATWCSPCVKQIPHLTKVQASHKDAVVVIGMASSERQKEGERDARLERLKAFVEKQGDAMGYRVAYDAERRMSKSWMQPAGQKFIPTAFVVDGEGTIVYIGSPAEMDGVVEGAVKKAKEKA
ncbi:MAG: TlpA family protein disulfide reductase [Phycisphaeraceae bacterium]|nr:TlpA family protein disulfide reductase [Phycisphaeraceae bacterium]